MANQAVPLASGQIPATETPPDQIGGNSTKVVTGVPNVMSTGSSFNPPTGPGAYGPQGAAAGGTPKTGNK